MKRLAAFLLAALMSCAVFADTYVQGYIRKDGTYVPGHYRSSPDQYRYNNRGSQSLGGTQRDEYSNNGATNKTNSGYGLYDNDRDGLYNSYDPKPESKNNCYPGIYGC